jgi:uncharacterized protein (TIGR00369 family)
MIDPQRASAIAVIQGAPLSALLGLKIEAAADGSARIRLPFSENNLNAGGSSAPVHGGAIAALIDTSACAAVWSLAETTRSATVALSVNYVKAAIKVDLIASAKVREKGRTIASLTVDVHDARGQLIAHGLVTYKIA